MKTELEQKIFNIIDSWIETIDESPTHKSMGRCTTLIYELLNEELQKESIAFTEWIMKKQYVKYWGSQTNDIDKWYDYPAACTQPIIRPLKLFTSEELYKQFKTEPK